MSQLTLLDLAKLTNSDPVIGLIEDVTAVQPELRLLPARPRAGTTYNVSRRTSLPAAGFRKSGVGVSTGKSLFTQETKSMFFFDAQLEVDESIAQADGRQLGDVLAIEAAGAMQATGNTVGTQVYYGTAADANGFDGLVTLGAAQTVDATGSGGSTTSAWLAWLDPGFEGLHLSVGLNGTFQMGQWAKQKLLDANSKSYMAWVNNLSFWIGMAVGSDKSLFRVKNITAAAPLTDALGYQLVSKVPLNRRGNLVWFMNRDALFYLQKSRTAITYQTAGKAGTPAFPEIPTMLAGYPIIPTDSITSTEAAS